MSSENFGFDEHADLHPVERMPVSDLPSSARPISVPVAMVALGLVGLALVGSVFLMMRGGEEASGVAVQDPGGEVTVPQGDPGGLDGVAQAQDAQAQAALQAASQAAMAINAESADPSTGYTAVTPEALGAFDPSANFSTAESTGPEMVSVASTTTGWAAAAVSDSGTCYWVHIEGDVTTFGSGAPCTGEAAMAAVEPSWETG
jgi:hypothetical protein